MVRKKDMWAPEYQKKSGLKLLLSVREAAQAFAVSERTLWQMTKDGARHE